MSKVAERFFVLTGGPGSGKSTLLDALEGKGFARTVEAGRGIIQDQVSINGQALPWRNPQLFAEMMLSWEMRSYHSALNHAGPVFFDRSVLDVIGYLRLMNLPVPSYMQQAAQTFTYYPRVFIAPPWPDIFKQDSERKQSFAEAERTYQAMVTTYTEYGYQLVPLPFASIEERLQFVIEQVDIKKSRH